jgi:hypothetical protein
VLPLGLDTFAVSAAIGVTGHDSGRRLRLSLLMAAFEAGIPLVGLALGAPLGHAVGARVCVGCGERRVAYRRVDGGILCQICDIKHGHTTGTCWSYAPRAATWGAFA